RNSGGTYSLGMAVRVRLLEATPVQGGLRFEMLTKPAEKEGKKERPKRKPDPLTRHQKAKMTAKRSKKKGNAKPKREAAPAAETTKTSAPARKKPTRPAPAKLQRRPRKSR
ncbi:MAG: hypothetical protein AAF830_14010, partial [Pseudomonadota bacterium]